jgi:hypothetical protein
MTGEVSDFDVAKDVADRLRALDRQRQIRVIRWVAESLEIDLGQRQQGDPITPLDPLPQPPSPRLTSIKDFIGAKKPMSDMQFAAVVAYFHKFEAPVEQRRATVTPDLLQDAARLAGRPRLRKPNITLNNAKNQGYLDRKAHGEYEINSVGENLVAMTMPNTDGRVRPPRKNSKKRRTRS